MIPQNGASIAKNDISFSHPFHIRSPKNTEQSIHLDTRWHQRTTLTCAANERVRARLSIDCVVGGADEDEEWLLTVHIRNVNWSLEQRESIIMDKKTEIKTEKKI